MLGRDLAGFVLEAPGRVGEDGTKPRVCRDVQKILCGAGVFARWRSRGYPG